MYRSNAFRAHNARPPASVSLPPADRRRPTRHRVNLRRASSTFCRFSLSASFSLSLFLFLFRFSLNCAVAVSRSPSSKQPSNNLANEAHWRSRARGRARETRLLIDDDKPRALISRRAINMTNNEQDYATTQAINLCAWTECRSLRD